VCEKKKRTHDEIAGIRGAEHSAEGTTDGLEKRGGGFASEGWFIFP